jgi:hypothetical protein
MVTKTTLSILGGETIQALRLREPITLADRSNASVRGSQNLAHLGARHRLKIDGSSI